MLSWCWLRWLRSPINDCAAALTCPTQLSDGPWLPKSWRSAPDGGSGRLASLVEFQCSTSCLSFCSTFFLYQLVLNMNMSPHHLICSGMLNGWIHLRYINAFCALKLELDSWEPKYVLSMAANPKRSAFSATTRYPPVSSLSILSNFSSSGSCAICACHHTMIVNDIMKNSWILHEYLAIVYHFCIICASGVWDSLCVCAVFVLRMYTYFVLLQCLVIIHVRITCPPAICQRFARIGGRSSSKVNSSPAFSFSFLTASVAFITSFYGWGISKGARLMHTCCDGCNLNLLNFFGLFLLWDIDLGSPVLCLWIIQCSYSVNRRLTVTKIIPCHIVPQFRIASMPTQVHANLIVLNCSQRTRPPKRKDMPKTSSTFESTEPHAVSRGLNFTGDMSYWPLAVMPTHGTMILVTLIHYVVSFIAYGFV